MPLNANATMVLLDYIVEDLGVRAHFVCYAPGADQPTDYSVFMSHADYGTVVTLNQLQTKLEDALRRQYRNEGYSVMDQAIAASYSVVI